MAGYPVLSTTLAVFICLISFTQAVVTRKAAAKVYPGDHVYPGIAEWNVLNTTLNGKLIRSSFSVKTPFTTERASRGGCGLPSSHYEHDSSLIESLWWGGQGCKDCPVFYTPTTCAIGNHPNYVVKALKTEDVVAAVKFANKYNLRLVVKNTGHDFMGRNLGYGSLSIWTHHMRGIKWNENWVPTGTNSAGNSSSSRPKPISVVTYGAGEQWANIYEEGYARNKILTGGTTGSVGAGGGWLMGGGHGFYSNRYGLGVDNVVEFEVVLPDGNIVIANEISNQDLFWALRGGGGGTFGVVTQVTMRTYPHEVSNAVILSAYPATSGFDGFVDGMTYLMSVMPEWTDWGLTGHMLMTRYFFSGSVDAPGRSLTDITKFLAPHVDELWKRGVLLTYVRVPNTISSWLIAKNLDVNSLTTSWVEGYPMVQASRLIGREGLKNTTAMGAAIKYLFENYYVVEPFNVAGGAVARVGKQETALNPAWRDAYVHMSMLPMNQLRFKTVGDVEEGYKRIQRDVEYLDKVSVDSASYVNEACYLEPQWKKTLWGSNYDRLLEIKEKYDPNNTLWCTLCVGSDRLRLGDDMKLYHTNGKH